MNTQPQPSPEQKRMVRMIMTIAGFGFIVFGLATFAVPAIGAMIFDGDTFITHVFGGSLVFVGIMDIVIARVLFKEDTK